MSAATWPGTELGAGLEILESTIPGAGWGLFATRPFPKWAVITTYAGTWVNRKDYGLYPCKTHFIAVNNHEAIDGLKDPAQAQRDGPARFRGGGGGGGGRAPPPPRPPPPPPRGVGGVHAHDSVARGRVEGRRGG
jgi:hypothetical protein